MEGYENNIIKSLTQKKINFEWHNNEIFNYKSCDEFINWFEPIIRRFISLTWDLNQKVYIEK